MIEHILIIIGLCLDILGVIIITTATINNKIIKNNISCRLYLK